MKIACCEHCPHEGGHISCPACDIDKPIVAYGEYEIVRSLTPEESAGYVKFDILGVPVRKAPFCDHALIQTETRRDEDHEEAEG